MKILITGASGMLGWDLVKVLSPDHKVIPFVTQRGGRTDDPEPAILNESLIAETLEAHHPEVVVHTAAYTDVDGAEEHRERAALLNIMGTQNMVNAANRCGATFFFVSTDYVFDGRKAAPYDEADQPNPIGVYGHTKYEAEKYVEANAHSAFIIRTAWLFGAKGENFFRSILRLASDQENIRIVEDQKGAPTYTKDLAGAFRTLIEKADRRGGCRIYHMTNSGLTTWHHAAETLLKKIHFAGELVAISSNELARPAKRPANSVLDTKKIQRDFGIRLRPWEAALDEFWNEVLSDEWESQTRVR